MEIPKDCMPVLNSILDMRAELFTSRVEKNSNGLIFLVERLYAIIWTISWLRLIFRPICLAIFPSRSWQ
jgi:hypothetical protein